MAQHLLNDLDVCAPFASRATTDTVTALGEVITRHIGTSEVRLKLVKGHTARVFELPHHVKISADLFGELKSLLGPNCLT